MIVKLWWLIVGHFLCDYVFQTETIALNKRRVLAPEDLVTMPRTFVRAVPWGYWMLAHALTHGAWVSAVTGKVYLGVAETVCHFLIDTVKCERMISHRVDQALHLLCKAAWLFIGLLEA